MIGRASKNLMLLGAIFLLSGCGVKVPPNEAGDLSEPINPQPVINEPSAEEQQFLDSGRAKAIVDETDLWQLHESDEAGFSLRFPHDVSLDAGAEGTPYVLNVSVNPIDGLEGTLGFNEEVAKRNAEALSDGRYGDSVDFPFRDSMTVRDLGGVNAQDFLVFGRFEVCDVATERKLYFFHDDQQVVITLSMPRGLLSEVAPRYFSTDSANCGDSSVWGQNQQKALYIDLINGDAPAVVQRWYDLFDDIVDTLVFSVTEDENVGDIIGRWQSLDDEKSVIEFRDGQKLDYYAGEQMGVGDYVVNSVGQLTVTSDNDAFVYKIVEVSEDNLVLVYLDRGNTLSYRRMAE